MGNKIPSSSGVVIAVLALVVDVFVLVADAISVCDVSCAAQRESFFCFVRIFGGPI